MPPNATHRRRSPSADLAAAFWAGLGIVIIGGLWWFSGSGESTATTTTTTTTQPYAVVLETPPDVLLAIGESSILTGDVVLSDGARVPAVFDWCGSDQPLIATVDPPGVLTAHHYGSATVTCLVGDASAETSVAVVPGTSYTPIEIDYLREIAFSLEYEEGSIGLHRWEEPVRIAVYGDAADQDLDTIADVIANLISIPGVPDVAWVTEDPNITVRFLPLAEFATFDPTVPEELDGYFRYWSDAGDRVYRAEILIASGISQSRRDHATWEEITQVFGPSNDSWSYPDSLFYQGANNTHEWTTLDRLVMEMLYRPELEAGMTEAEAVEILKGLRRR